MDQKAAQKERTHQKMLEALGRGFQSHGFAGIGVDGLAKEAGVTSGAFYAHFGSKAAAFDAALTTGLDATIGRIERCQREYGVNWVKVLTEYCLSRAQRQDLAHGCALGTLTTEVVRSGPNVHKVFERKMARMVDLVTGGLAGPSDEERRTRAWAFLSLLIGGINVARAVKSGKTADEVTKATIAAAIKTAGRTRAVRPKSTKRR